MIPVEFSQMTDIVVIGVNPENADYENPRGEIYGYASYVVATSERGERRRMFVNSGHVAYEKELLQEAEEIAIRLTTRLNSLSKLPVGFDMWEEYFPVYGSPAFSNQEMIEWEASLEE
jgi:hypothetical protein